MDNRVTNPKINNWIAKMYPMETGGPPTMVCLFAYGGFAVKTFFDLVVDKIALFLFNMACSLKK